MNKEKLRLIEMQDVASVARDNMGNYCRVERWGYNDKIALCAFVVLILFLFAVCFI